MQRDRKTEKERNAKTQQGNIGKKRCPPHLVVLEFPSAMVLSGQSSQVAI